MAAPASSRAVASGAAGGGANVLGGVTSSGGSRGSSATAGVVGFVLGAVTVAAGVAVWKRLRSGQSAAPVAADTKTPDAVVASNETNSTTQSSATAAGVIGAAAGGVGVPVAGGALGASQVVRGDTAELLREQFSRNVMLFGEEGQEAVRKGFVVVVGVGGVGSHAAHMLLRSGVGRVRLIDFDQVSVSSLNRHATATRADVGRAKVHAIAQHTKLYAPSTIVEPIQQMFTAEAADDLLAGNPDFVLDCIDDVNTKIALLLYCKQHNIKVLSAFGAGCKVDPTRIHIADISDCIEDALARKIRRELRKHNIETGITVLYSTERTTAKLQHFSEDHMDRPEEYGAVENFRVGVLPVLGPLPAIFGCAMASYVLCQLANYEMTPVDVKRLNRVVITKMYTHLMQREKNLYGAADVDLSIEEMEYMMRFVWKYRSALGSKGMLQGQSQVACRWDRSKPLSMTNMVLVTKNEADRLHTEGLDFVDADTRARVEQVFARVADMLRTEHILVM